MFTPLTSRAPLYLTLLVLLAAVYMVTYTGRVEIADELQYYDAAGSLARFGDTKTGVSAWQFMPNNFREQGSTPTRPTIAEPLFIYASAPLYALADAVEGLGLAHTAWLFNIVMTPLVCLAFFALAQAVGFSRRAALVSAIALGLLTVLWPYSSRFFREQLMMVFLLLTALALEHWRRNPRRVWLMLIGVGCFVLAYLTKEASVLALPALVTAALPDRVWRATRARRVSAGLMIAALLTPLVMVYTPLLDWLPPVPLFGFYRLEPAFTRTALHTYLFSIGGSFWGTSPVLLLGLIGAPLLMREGRHRLVWVAVLMMLGFAVSYGLLRGEEWFGGTIWPQRFLMPLIPFVMLLTVPIFERVLDSPRRHRALLIAVGVLALYSLWWQLVGVGFRWDAYGNATFDLSGGGLVYWSGGFNDLRYIRPVVLSGVIGQQPLNAAWVRVDLFWPPMLFVGLAFAALVILRALMRSTRAARGIAYILPLILVALMFGAVRALYDADPLYQARPDLHAMVETLRARATTETPILINDPEYAMFFYNYGKVGRARLITLPYHPGDRGSCDQPLLIESPNPAALIAPPSAQVIHYLAAHHPRVGLLMFDAPETPCIVRPLERFMGQRYYRVGEIRTDANVRLLEYATQSAPDPDGFIDAEVTRPLTFTLPNGDALRLIGFTLPRGESYQAGDALPLSLRFEAIAPTQAEFTVAWYVADADGRVWVEGENTWPAATFKPTSALVQGEQFWDNRAAFLPADLPAGTYQLWVRLYTSDPNSGAITLAEIDGAGVVPIGDGDMAVLPVEITVNAR